MKLDTAPALSNPAQGNPNRRQVAVACIILSLVVVGCSGDTSAARPEGSASRELRSSSVRTESTATSPVPATTTAPSTAALDLSASSPSTVIGHDPFAPERSNPEAANASVRPSPEVTSAPSSRPVDAPRPSPLADDLPKTIASDAKFTATVDDVGWSQWDTNFDPGWNAEQRTEWRRSLYLENRFIIIETLIGLEAIDLEASILVEGMSPPYTTIEGFLIALHNNAERIEVVYEDGSTEPLSRWFAVFDRIPQAVYESAIEYSIESP